MGAARDARVKVNIPEKPTEAGGRADSPEQSISTPSYETQSGFKRLRTTGWEELEGSEHGESADEEAPGTSKVVATEEEVRQLQERTKSACSQLADVIVQLRRERYARSPRLKKDKKLLAGVFFFFFFMFCFSNRAAAVFFFFFPAARDLASLEASPSYPTRAR